MEQSLQSLTKDMTIRDIIESFPEVVEPLLEMGVHCVGCHVSEFETLEEGLQGHGFDEQAINDILSKLSKIVEEKRQEVKVEAPKKGDMSISPLAIEKVKEFCQQKGKKALRIAVKVGGCSGKEYIFDLAENAGENDIIIEQDGAKVFVDKESMQEINGSILNYNDGLTGAGFVIENPNAKAMCGCGKSFN